MILAVTLALTTFLANQAMALTNPVPADITVVAVQSGQTVSAVTTTGETLVTEHRYIGLDESTETVNSEIRFSGINAQAATEVIVSIPDADIAQMTLVGPDGSWQLSVPTARLPDGQRYATVQYKSGDTVSAPLTIAEFEVRSAESLSSSTWVFLFSTATAIVALLLAITLQLRYNLRHHPVL